MNVAGDGNYNLKILNDAFEGRAHENEEIDLINVDGEMQIKTRTKRPPADFQKTEVKKTEVKKAPSAAQEKVKKKAQEAA